MRREGSETDERKQQEDWVHTSRKAVGPQSAYSPSAGVNVGYRSAPSVGPTEMWLLSYTTEAEVPPRTTGTVYNMLSSSFKLLSAFNPLIGF